MQLFDAFLIHLHTMLQHDGFYILKRHIGVERDPHGAAEELPGKRLVLLRDDVHDRRIADEDQRHACDVVDAAQRFQCRDTQEMRLVDDDGAIRTLEDRDDGFLQCLVAPRLLLVYRFQNFFHHVAPIVDVRRGRKEDAVRMRCRPFVDRHRLADARSTVNADDVVSVVRILQTEPNLLHDGRFHDIRLLDRHHGICPTLLRLQYGEHLLRDVLNAPFVLALEETRQKSAGNARHLRKSFAADVLMFFQVAFYAHDRLCDLPAILHCLHQKLLLFSIFVLAISSNGLTCSVPVACMARTASLPSFGRATISTTFDGCTSDALP